MEPFTIQIAGIATEVIPLFGSTREYFKQYLCTGPAAFTVRVTQTDLAQEQRLLDEEADELQLRRRVFTPPFLERAAIGRQVARFALTRDILLLHGSTVAVDGRAYLFTAKTGTGKSTHVRYWRELFGSRAVTVNDDRTFLRSDGGSILACGSPWSGKHGLDTNITAPLAGICILRRGSENCITPLTPEEAMPAIAEQVFIPAEDCREQCLSLAQELTRFVPLWSMACTKDADAARIAYSAMSE